MDKIIRLLERIAAGMECARSPWLTATQADRYVGQSHGTVSRLCKAGIIESRKIGRARYVHTDWLDAWMMSHPSGTDEHLAALSDM